MTTFTRESINAIYTNIITDYIAKGYVISTQTHNGSFSREICHIDLCKDNKSIIRVWMMSECSENTIIGHYDIKITVRQYKNSERTFWPDNGELLLDKWFYNVSHKCDYDYYTDSVDEYASVVAVRHHRWDMRALSKVTNDRCKYISTTSVSDTFKTNVLKRINSIRGAKRAKFDCVKSIMLSREATKRVAYIEWEFNNKSGTITLR